MLDFYYMFIKRSRSSVCSTIIVFVGTEFAYSLHFLLYLFPVFIHFVTKNQEESG